MITNININKELHRRLGLTWHDSGWFCCDFVHDWNDWGNILLPWCKKQEWWNKFYWEYAMNEGKFEGLLDHLSPLTFCRALITFLGKGA